MIISEITPEHEKECIELMAKALHISGYELVVAFHEFLEAHGYKLIQA